MMLGCLSVLVSGCGIRTDGYCDIASPLIMDSQRTVSWLVNNDRGLLVSVLVHNETNDRLCGG